jgi:hypothetical protein
MKVAVTDHKLRRAGLRRAQLSRCRRPRPRIAVSGVLECRSTGVLRSVRIATPRPRGWSSETASRFFNNPLDRYRGLDGGMRIVTDQLDVFVLKFFESGGDAQKFQ